MKRVYLGGLAFISSLLLIAFSMIHPLIEASTGDDIDGDFTIRGFNNAPQVLAFQGPTFEGNYTLTPQEEYSMSITVEDEDGLSDLKALELRFYYAVTPSAVGTQPNDFSDLEEIFLAHDTTNIRSTAFVIRWENQGTPADNSTEAGDDDPQDGFYIVSDSAITPGLITWEITQSTVPAIQSDDTNLTGTSFTFEVSFKISKVARETIQNLWRIGAKIEDARTIVDFVEDQENNGTTVIPSLRTSTSQPVGTGFDLNQSDSYQMNFYGEIQIPTASAINWIGQNEDGTVSVGTRFSDNINTSLAGIRYIANSEFNEQIQSSPLWEIVSGSGTNVPTDITNAAIQESTLSGSDSQKFRLAVSEEGTFNLDDVTIIPANNQRRDIFDEPSDWTNEAGIDYTFYFYLELSQIFRNAQYTGQIIFTVTNFVPTS